MEHTMSVVGKSPAGSTFGKCNGPRFVFGSSTANASTGFGTSSSPSATSWASAFGRPAPAIGGFQTAAGSPASPHGNSIFCFSAAPPAPTLGLPTKTPAFGSKEISSGFGNSVLAQNGKGSRVTPYTATVTLEDGQRIKIVSICAMKIHSMKSHEDLRAEDYQLGDKGGIRHASVSQGPTGVTGTQQHSSFPAPSSNTIHPNVPVFPSSFAPKPSIDTIGKGWSSVAKVTPPTPPNTLPWMQSRDANGLVSSQPNVAISLQPFTNTSVLPTNHNHSNPAATNPFAFQTKRVGNDAFIGRTKSTGVESLQNPFTAVTPSSSGWPTSPVNAGIQSDGSRLAPYTATVDQERCKIQSIFAMAAYKNKSHEQLRAEDYHLGDKGGCKDGIFPTARNEASSPLKKTLAFPPAAHQWPSNNFSPSNVSFPPQKAPFPATNTQNSSQNCFPCSNPLTNPATPLIPFTFNISTTAQNCSTVVPPATRFNFSPTSLPSVSYAIPGKSTEISSNFTNNGSQSLQSSHTIPNPVPQYISSPMTPIQVPQNITSSVITTFEQQPVIANFCEALNMEQTSIRRPETILPIHYGISSRPVIDNPAPARGSSLVRVRHLSIRRNRLQADKCNAKSDAPKVAFFTEVERNCGPVKASSSIIPRNNPGCWISSPSKELFHKADPHVSRPQSITSNSSEDGTSGSASDDDRSFVKTDQHVDATAHGDQDVEVVANPQDHNEYLEVILPKLSGADYYTEPSITEIAAKEKTEPGFCSHVKDFIIGRVGYGCIKFLGETDIRKLEINSIIEFNHREILVYFNESMEKPPVGQGLNKAAEITLLNINCSDKKSGKQYIDGPMVDKYRERLIKKTAEQGAEFVSFNPVRGEWQFKVQHF